VLIVDADAHVAEGANFGRQAMERWPDKITFESTPSPGLRVEGRRYPEHTGPGAGCPPQHGLSRAAGLDPSSVEGMLANADADHIDKMVLYPSFGLCAPSLQDPDFAAGFCRFYNEWLSDWCARSSGRLFGVAVVPLAHTEEATKVLSEAREMGMVAAMIPPALPDRNLDHPSLDPFYAAAEELDLALGVHGAPGIHLPKIGVDRFDNYIQVHCVSFPFDQMTAMTALVSGGVFDRHPRLRVGFLEAGVGWVPYFLDRLHEHYEKRGDWIPGGWQRDPLEYLEAGNIWVSCEPEEPILPGVIDVLGSGFIMYASDYPHWDGEWPRSTEAIRTRSDIGEADRAKVAGANASRFYRLP